MTDASPDAALVLERVELALPELFPGYRTEERKVSFDGQLVADLLGRAGGRTLMISLVGEDEQEVALKALDGLAFARAQRELLADYLPGETFAGASPEVVLVARAFSPRLRARLAPLMGQGDLLLVTRHELSSARGSLTRLRLDPEGSPRPDSADSPALPEWATREPLVGFLACVAPDRLALALQLVERVQRIDPSLSWAAGEGASLVCRLDQRSLCSVAWKEGHLELCLGDGTVPHAVRDEEAIDFVLDWVLSCFMELVEEARVRLHETPEEAASPAEVSRSCDSSVSASLEGAYIVGQGPEAAPADSEEELDELEEFELRPSPPPPLLTPEELEAFLD